MPKQRVKREADITPRIITYFEKRYDHSVALEIKIKGNRTLPHQRAALSKVQDGVFSFKLPDQGQRNPFDAFVLHGADAFVVVYDPKTKTCTVYCPKTNAVQFSFKP